MGNREEKKQYFFHKKRYDCAFSLAIDLIGGKWKAKMIYQLRDSAKRSSDLQRSMHEISNKMFTQTARELEHEGIIFRKVYPTVPPKVEYDLTDLGKSVLPVILQLEEWGIKISDKV
ncbi:helix-turn-helix transcriptional regulator [Prevotella cerevisiae]|uniref:Helix-turn-helix transcriptional regulator n=1 Tax=Segatella cerevisiae TaxID=2053716 RepID=A0ABT1BUC9_9BACT|nr:helix-turn-helix domain-containing protein [Segatella cerevisiae]MCO6024574.1 helix-turn-helix transcriptional regulator [Segatella cerevisiae]